MTIRIVTDSTCDLPPKIAEEYGISVIPCYINVGEKSFLDGIDITRQAFYQGLPVFSQHPKTSAPGIGIFTEIYQRLADEGVREVISMHIHAGLSNLSNAARIAAETIGSVRITVIEIGQITLGLGFLALSAAQAALEGKSIEEIIQVIKSKDERTYVYAALDTLDYLRAGGRAPGLMVGIANFLRIKPILQLHRGDLRMVGQVRTSSKALQRLTDYAHDLGALERIAVMHTNAFEKAQELAGMLKEGFFEKTDIWISEATPVLGVHTGPGAVGLACVKA